MIGFYASSLYLLSKNLSDEKIIFFSIPLLCRGISFELSFTSLVDSGILFVQLGYYGSQSDDDGAWIFIFEISNAFIT
jgi:hypothetical protein